MESKVFLFVSFKHYIPPRKSDVQSDQRLFIQIRLSMVLGLMKKMVFKEDELSIKLLALHLRVTARGRAIRKLLFLSEKLCTLSKGKKSSVFLSVFIPAELFKLVFIIM